MVPALFVPAPTRLRDLAHYDGQQRRRPTSDRCTLKANCGHESYASCSIQPSL